MVILTIFGAWHFYLFRMVKTVTIIWIRMFQLVSCYSVFKKSATPSSKEIEINLFSEIITVLLKLPWYLFGQVCVYSGMKVDVCQ